MVKVSMHLESKIGPGDVPAERTTLTVAPAYAFVDGTAINWPVPVTIDLTDGEGTVSNMETTYLGEPLVWAFRLSFENGRGGVIGSYSATKTFPEGATGTIEYSNMIDVDPVSDVPGYGPTWAEQARVDAGLAEAARDEAVQAAADAASFGVAGWANSLAFAYAGITRLPSGNIDTATITWPDGVTGTWTTDTEDPTFQVITSFHFTRAGTPTVTFTQPTMTLDTNGSVINQPVLVVS